MEIFNIIADTTLNDEPGSILKYGNMLVDTVLIENMLLSLFLGMCSFLAISRSLKTAFGLGVAVIFVLTCTAVINCLMYKYLLSSNGLVSDLAGKPVDLTYLKPIVFIMTIAAFVQLVEMVVERTSPVLYVNLGIYLPLITVNCAVLGVSTTIVRDMEDSGASESLMTLLPEWTVLGFGNGLGWMHAICLMAGIREKLKHADIPRPLQGLSITLIITGIMAMAFTGFAGIDLLKALGFEYL